MPADGDAVIPPGPTVIGLPVMLYPAPSSIVIPEAVAYIRGARTPAVRNVDEDAAHQARSVD